MSAKRRIPVVIHDAGRTTIIGSFVIATNHAVGGVTASIIDAAAHPRWPAIRRFELSTIAGMTVMAVPSADVPRAYLRGFRGERPIMFRTSDGDAAAAAIAARRGMASPQVSQQSCARRNPETAATSDP